jgi:hypothetical protein
MVLKVLYRFPFMDVRMVSGCDKPMLVVRDGGVYFGEYHGLGIGLWVILELVYERMLNIVISYSKLPRPEGRGNSGGEY